MRPLVVALSVLLGACIVPAPGGEGGRGPQQTKRTVVAPATPITVRSGANLEDKVEIVGATFNPGRVAPGETIKVTAVYKVNAPLVQDYMVFVHVEDVDGRVERFNADHRPAGGGYPTSQWKVGETVKDEFSLYVPPGMTVRGLNVYLGFWDPQTDARLVLKNVKDVRNDGKNRVLVANVPVGL